METADYQAILGLVAAGVGVALIPRMAVHQARRNDVVALALAKQPIRRRVEIALPAGGYLPPITQELVDCLVSATADLDRPPDQAPP